MSILIGESAAFPFDRAMLVHLLIRSTYTLPRRMHQISDGERRRVQLCMGLMGNWDVLLLDEVTVDLDALVRAELLAFLVKESKERGATIVCKSPFLRYFVHSVDPRPNSSDRDPHRCHPHLRPHRDLPHSHLSSPPGDHSGRDGHLHPDLDDHGGRGRGGSQAWRITGDRAQVAQGR